MYHRITEAFKWAYAVRSKLGDPSDSNITEVIEEVDFKLVYSIFVKVLSKYIQIVANVTSDDFGFQTFLKIDDSLTVNNASYYGADFLPTEDFGTTHMGVISANGDAVAITSTINQ